MIYLFFVASFLISIILSPFAFEQSWKDFIKTIFFKGFSLAYLICMVLIYMVKPEFIYHCLWLGILFILAFVDFKNKSVRLMDLVFLSFAQIPIILVKYAELSNNISVLIFSELMITVFIGVALISLKFILKMIYKQDALGGADIWVMLTIIFSMSGISSIIAIYAAIIYSALAGTVAITVFKKSKKSQIPFIPFLLCGVLTSIFFYENIYNTYLSLLK